MQYICNMKYTVEHSSPLLKYLYEIMPDQSRTSVKKYLEDRRIQVNGEITGAFDLPLRHGDVINIVPKGVAITESVRIGAREEAELKGVRIIYEDEWIIIIDKKAGVPTIRQSTKEGDTAYSILTSYVKAKAGAERHHLKIYGKGPARVFIVHRIDMGTSGLLLFAKDERTKDLLQSKWNSMVLERKYKAVVEGCIAPPVGTVESWLTENEKSFKMSSSPFDDGGEHAVSHYRITAPGKKYSAVEFELETGRKNQIRVHCQVLGHPIAGDRKYGASSNPIRRLALHAATLVFRHPHTNEVMRFTSPVPKEFDSIIH